MPMRGHGNVTGADVIMRWQTGYPFGIQFGRGYPRFNPGEYSTIDLLVRGDCDAALILGADPGATMPQPCIDHLARIRERPERRDTTPAHPHIGLDKARRREDVAALQDEIEALAHERDAIPPCTWRTSP